MRGLDTNVLVRLLIADDPAQVQAVQTLLDGIEDETFFVPVTVLLEVLWVLGAGQYKLPRASLISTLETLLGHARIELQHEEAVEVALDYYKTHNHPDIADCLHLAICTLEGHVPLVTFDKRLTKLPDTLAL